MRKSIFILVLMILIFTPLVAGCQNGKITVAGHSVTEKQIADAIVKHERDIQSVAKEATKLALQQVDDEERDSLGPVLHNVAGAIAPTGDGRG